MQRCIKKSLLRDLELELAQNWGHRNRNWPGMVATGVGIGLKLSKVDSDTARLI